MPLAQAVPFLESFASEGDQVYDNHAEWLTAVMVRAERENQGPELAAKYASSKLKADSDALIATFVQSPEETDEVTRQELAVKSSTVTPNWFAFKTLIKVTSESSLKSLMDAFGSIDRRRILEMCRVSGHHALLRRSSSRF